MKTKTYIIGILIPLAIGALSALLSGSMDIYQSITTPPLAPPGFLFPIVWTVLYVLMGISSVLVYNSEADAPTKKEALVTYALQLVANFFWSILFFGQQAFLASFVLLVILWLLILGMISSFTKINKTAGLLQIPYLLWVTFAGYLNLAIYFLNR